MAAVAESPATVRLRAFYKLGKDLLKISVKHNASRADVKNYWGVNDELQKEYSKLSLNDIACARRFAERYSEDDLDTLCKLGQTCGKPLNKSHMFSLVMVKTKKDRQRWASKAAAGSWSVLRLRFEIAAVTLKPPSEGEGSDPKYLGSVHALYYTRRLACKWMNWHKLLKKNRALVRGNILGPLLKAVANKMDPLLTELEKAIELRPKAAKARKKSVPKKRRSTPRSRKSTTANNAQRQRKRRPKR